jgi:hypothetical protein
MKGFVGVMLLGTLLVACGSLFGAQVSVGITIGPPPPPPVVHVLPPSAGPEFVWVEGYWYLVKKEYKWHEGYWTQAPYPGARWVVHYEGGQSFAGYWEGDRGRWQHDHRWDQDADRDFPERKDKEKDKGYKREKEHGHDRN